MYNRVALTNIFSSIAVKRGHFKLASGRESSYYIDKMAVTLDSDGLYLVATGIWDIIRPTDCTAIGGMTLGADPIVGGVLTLAYKQKLKGFIVRKETKEHGTGQRIEGTIGNRDTVAIVEDVTTGGSALAAIEQVRQTGAKIWGVIAVVDRQEGAAEAFAAAGIHFQSLLTVADILQDHTSTP